MKYLESFKSALLASVPIVIIRCPDSASVMEAIAAAAPKRGMVHWDINRGVTALNPDKAADMAAQKEINEGEAPAVTSANPQEALMRAVQFMPSDTVLFMENMHLPLECREEGNRLVAIQSVLNCRDPFKSSGRTLVLLVPDIKVPVELQNDVITLDVPLPDERELAVVIQDIMKAGEQPPLEEKPLQEAVGAISGLSRFVAENSVAMSLRESGLDISSLWDRKVAAINAVGGLTVHRGDARFDKLGGLENIKNYGRMIINGKRRPRLVVLWDEIEKAMSGLGDSNGINADMFGQILSAMQDYGWDGMLLPGFPGTGKTEFANAMGAEAGGLFVKFDVGGTKGGIVGDSEKMIRAAIRTLLAMGGENVLWVGTCNSMEQLRPELKRRFAYGTFFFDLPTEAEQLPIWDIYRKRFNIPADSVLPPCDGWTGAEIKKVCKLADEFGIPLTDAAKYISPVAKAMGENVDKLRQSAAGKYLSATSPGYYETKRSLDTKKVRQMIKEPKPSQN